MSRGSTPSIPCFSAVLCWLAAGWGVLSETISAQLPADPPRQPYGTVQYSGGPGCQTCQTCHHIDPNMTSNGPSGGQIMLIAKRLKNYTGYVTTKSRDRGVATSPPRSIICNTVQYGTSTIINLAISTSDCGTSTRTIVSLYVSDLPNVTKSTVLVRTRVFRRRLPVTDRQTDTRDVKSGGCTDNAKRTTQDSLRKEHEIGQSPPAHPKA